MDIKEFSINLTKKLFKYALITAATLAVIATIIFISWRACIYYWVNEPYGKMKFDQAAWLENKIECRGNMYNDITKNYLKKGMDIKKVEELLGKAFKTTYSLEERIKCTSYYLGNCQPLPLRSSKCHLTICFNKNYKILNYTNNCVFSKQSQKWAHCYASTDECTCYKKITPLSNKHYTCYTEKW